MTAQASRIAQRFSRRLIPFDVGYVTSFAQKVTEEALKYLLGIVPDNDAIGDHLRAGTICAADNLTLRTVKGVDTEFRVQLVVGKVSRDDRYTFGHYDSERQAIVVFLSPGWTSEDLGRRSYEVINKVKSIVIHEVTHALDIIDRRRRDPDLEVYYNSPHEVKAFARQVIDEAGRILKGLRLKSRASKKPMLQGASLVEAVLSESPTWREVGKHLNSSNNRYVRQILVRELDL